MNTTDNEKFMKHWLHDDNEYIQWLWILTRDYVYKFSMILGINISDSPIKKWVIYLCEEEVLCFRSDKHWILNIIYMNIPHPCIFSHYSPCNSFLLQVVKESYDNNLRYVNILRAYKFYG